MALNATQRRILNEAKRMVRSEKLADFMNDYKSYFHRRSTGYYDDRLVYITRWLVNDEQQHIDDYYGRR
ncbi:MAG: hypothetical protein LUH36_08935 [Oscillospiraceae bacterium]|nr:hypothetical protein [Oscillospiraceae bacterium]